MSITHHCPAIPALASRPRLRNAAVSAALAAAALFLQPALLPSTAAEAKTPGSTYCFNGICHRVRSIAETQSMVGRTETLATSFYDDCSRDRYNPCGLTSSGERFRADLPDNAASPIYPNGTTLLVYNPAAKRAAVVRVNNAGPYWGNRRLDVSRAAAEKLGFKHSGVAKLQVKVLKAPSKSEATYKRNRKYAPVPGFVGQFASLDAAHGSLVSVAALKAANSALVTPATTGGKRAAMAMLDLTRPSITGKVGPKIPATVARAAQSRPAAKAAVQKTRKPKSVASGY